MSDHEQREGFIPWWDERNLEVRQPSSAQVDDNNDIEEGVTVDLDEKGHVVGIEILGAIKKLSLKDIVNITIENFPVEKVETAMI